MPLLHTSQLNSLLVCILCQGYLRDAHTIPECLHSFCKSCILRHFHLGCRMCPKCHADLGVAPKCVFDRTLHEIVDKLFPHLKDTDAKLETEFYTSNGFQKQRMPIKPAIESACGPPTECPEVAFLLQPDTSTAAAFQLPPLTNPNVRMAGHLKVHDVIKLLMDRLRSNNIELTCLSTILTSDLSIYSVQRNVWKANAKMVWSYRKHNKDVA